MSMKHFSAFLLSSYNFLKRLLSHRRQFAGISMKIKYLQNEDDSVHCDNLIHDLIYYNYRKDYNRFLCQLHAIILSQQFKQALIKRYNITRQVIDI